MKKLYNRNDLIMDFKNRTWTVYGGAGYPVYLSPFTFVPSECFLKLYGIANETIVLWQGKQFTWLYDEQELIRLAQKVLPSLIRQGWQYYYHWQKQAHVFTAAHYRLMAANLMRLSETELGKLLISYYQEFIRQYENNNLIEPLSFYFQKHLSDILAQAGVNRGNINLLLERYALPARDNYLKECTKEYQSVKTKLDWDRLLEKYHYLNNDYTGPKHLTKNDVQKLVLYHQNQASTFICNKFKRVIINKKAKDILTLLQVTTTIQDMRKAQSLMWVSGAEKLIRELARRRRFPYQLLLFSTWRELMDDNFTRRSLAARSQQCVLRWRAGREDIFTGINARTLIGAYNKLVVGSVVKITEIKGIVASRGKARGRVVVVLNISQFNKVRTGDILVTVMTRPEYLPVLHLASAIVTDEGGLTCHAAIVAREMKIPCVIGTRIATKVLKDGDLVEVDAEKGIVRKL